MLELFFDANFSCTSSPRAKQVDALARVLHKRMGSFILSRESEHFDDNDVELIGFKRSSRIYLYLYNDMF